MIDNLLDTTRLEEGRQKLTPQPTNVHGPRGRHRRSCGARTVAQHRRPLEVREDLTVNIDPAALATRYAICSIMPSRPACRHGTPWPCAGARRRRDDRRQRRRPGFSAEEAVMIFEKFHPRPATSCAARCPH